jgi:hypothetical protein
MLKEDNLNVILLCFDPGMQDEIRQLQLVLNQPLTHDVDYRVEDGRYKIGRRFFSRTNRIRARRTPRATRFRVLISAQFVGLRMLFSSSWEEFFSLYRQDPRFPAPLISLTKAFEKKLRLTN